MGRPRPGARGGHRARPTSASTCWGRARHVARRTPARSRRASRARAAARTSSRSCATAARTATCCWSSCRTATSRRRWRASSTSTSAHLLLLRALDAVDRSRASRRSRPRRAKEVAYHAERSADWVIRLGDGTEESHARMQRALDDLWMYTGEMFAADAVELALVEAGIARRSRARCATPWLAAVARGARRGDARAAAPASGCRAQRARRQAGRAHRASRATCWPRCSSCSAPIRARSGDRQCDRRASGARRGRRARRAPADARTSSGRRSATVPDPEIPVDLDRRARHRARRGVGRRRGCVVEVTPTYSGCPATEMIDDADPRGARGHRRRRRRARATGSRRRGPPTGSRRRRSASSTAFGIAPPHVLAQRASTWPASVRCAARSVVGAVSALRVDAHAAPVAVRLDRVQGAVPLRRLPRAVRLLQAALSARVDEQIPSAARRARRARDARRGRHHVRRARRAARRSSASRRAST